MKTPPWFRKSSLVWMFLVPLASFPAAGQQDAPVKTAGTPQGTTFGEMAAIGAALNAWLADQLALHQPADSEISLAKPGTATLGPITFDVAGIPVISSMDLETLLVPTYLGSLPTLDGWGNPYELRLDTVDLVTRPAASIRSAGSDGTYGGTSYTPGFTATDTEDLVFVDSFFVRRPPPPAAEAADYTVQQLHRIASAFVSWRIDQVAFAAPTPMSIGLTGCDSYSVDVTTVPAMTADALEALLAPDYLAFLPRVDGWQNPLEFRFDTNLSLDEGSLALRSPGADGTYDSTTYFAGLTATDDEDLVSYDFYLIRRPPPLGKEQAETVSEIQALGATIFSWVTDQIGLQGQPNHNRSTGSQSANLLAAPFDTGDLVPITHAALEAQLVPFYLPCLAKIDLWGNAYDYWLDTNNLFANPLAGVRSRGSDDIAEGPIYFPGPFPTDFTHKDLLWVDGALVRFPDPTLLFLDGFEVGDLSEWSSSSP